MPSVTTAQWLVTLATVALACSGLLLYSAAELTALAHILCGLNLVLLAAVAREAVGTRLVGKPLLIGSTLLFFWLEAVDSARSDPAFAVPRGLPILGEQFSPELVHQAFLYIALFQAMLLVGYSLRPNPRRLMAWIGARSSPASGRGRLLPYVLAGCGLFAYLLSYRFDLGAALEALLAARSSSDLEQENIGLWHYLNFFGMYGAALLLARAALRRDVRRSGRILLGAVAALPFVLSGARHLWLFVALPVGVLVLSGFRGRVGLGRGVRWGGGVLVVLLIVQLQFALRTVGWQAIGSLTSDDLGQAGSTGQFTALLFAEYLVPELHDYFRELAEPYFAIHWIPRTFWPDKPVMESWAYYNETYTAGAIFNVTPSVIGQFHLSWGIVGVLFAGLWLGLLAALADRAVLAIRIEQQLAMGVTIGMFYAFIFASFRFYSPIYFTYFGAAVIGMLLLTDGRGGGELEASHAGRAVQPAGLS